MAEDGFQDLGNEVDAEIKLENTHYPGVSAKHIMAHMADGPAAEGSGGGLPAPVAPAVPAAAPAAHADVPIPAHHNPGPSEHRGPGGFPTSHRRGDLMHNARAAATNRAQLAAENNRLQPNMSSRGMDILFWAVSIRRGPVPEKWTSRAHRMLVGALALIEIKCAPVPPGLRTDAVRACQRTF